MVPDEVVCKEHIQQLGILKNLDTQENSEYCSESFA